MIDNRVILLVEDNPDDADLTIRALERARLVNKIVHVSDGPRALDYLFCRGDWQDRDPEERPALVLLDLKLPRLSGLEVLQRLRAEESTRLLPVVVLTSSVEENDIVGSYELGANSYVRKPVDFVRFAEAVTELGLFWLVLNEPPPDPTACAGGTG